MCPMEEQRFVPDDDATDLDKALFAVAEAIDTAGWSPDTVDELLSAMAVLRETWSQPGKPDATGIIDSLDAVESAAQTAKAIVMGTYPDPFVTRTK